MDRSRRRMRMQTTLEACVPAIPLRAPRGMSSAHAHFRAGHICITCVDVNTVEMPVPLIIY